MQFDQTRIAIRERGFFEILGLALQVTRAHALGLLAAFVAGILPFALLNVYLLYGWAQELWGEDTDSIVYFTWWMIVLVMLEAPLATAFITLYLGQITFMRQASAKEILYGFAGALPQLLWLQGVVRSLLIWVFLVPYWTHPYLGELILLERNPLFGRKRLTTMRRSRNLHSNSGGEIFGRWLQALIMGAGLVAALALSLEIAIAQLSSIEVTLTWRLLLVYHGVLWLVVGWMAVVRFLAYLDMRIRHEGWEVELLMRAEAQRLRRTMGMAGA